MGCYQPMKGPLPGAQFVPSNGNEGYSFIADWCSNCARDRSVREGVEIEECDDDQVCQIIGASFRGEAVEWREMPDGEVKCLAYVEAGAKIPAARCEHTGDLFAAVG